MSAVDKLSAWTGLSGPAIERAMREAQANQQRLASCARHDFQPVALPVQMGTRYACVFCGGTADGSAVHWYRLGQKHGARA